MFFNCYWNFYSRTYTAVTEIEFYLEIFWQIGQNIIFSEIYFEK